MSNTLFDISNKVILITGGTGVLGGSMAEYLLSEGAKIVLLGQTENKVKNKVMGLKESYSDVLGFSGSVLDKHFLEDVKRKVVQEWGRIDVLINAAGGNMPGAVIGEGQTIFDLQMEDFRKVSELNLDGSVIPSLVFGKQMTDQGHGCILNISSMAATRALTRVVGYSASKAAIDNFTKWMATELALKFGEGLRVNAIAPGFFISNQNQKLLLNEDGSYTDRGKKIIDNTPMKRFGNADELHGAVHWLISDAASFVTGAIIPIDGGFSAFSGV
ncbi:SDR family oxidoreductase [Flagellimonas pelagia]|uniref:SDR family oxidoreductase n=1 Tax=Flagellimonas pelagia TaxID=2306998 RepID=A0A3A1NI05_9FLAO|nr:SDR family oxidoreductase [Allomuricauda maritima]RIV43444.1 SDR family oxidoreductase [Allomuricauda maritima]TXJ92784.1 SDR family oxidoreductase [Allomuricauda maritima]